MEREKSEGKLFEVCERSCVVRSETCELIS